MESVQYPEDNKRPEISIVPSEDWHNILLTKSPDWSYEREWRTVLIDKQLESFRLQDLARIKYFKGKKTWFLRLNPESIRTVVFGLYTEKSLKSAVRKLIKRPELQHVKKLYQTEESDTYILNLKEC